MKICIFPLVGLILSVSATVCQAKTEIIELKSRMAADVLPAILPFLEPHERATEYGHQIIIQADTDKIAEIRQLVEQLDVPPKRLLISVDTRQSGVSTDRQISAQGRIKGKHGEVVIGQPGQGNNRVEIQNYSSQGRDTDIRTVQTIEGATALVQTGQQIEQRNWMLDQHRRWREHDSQRTLTQGFYVTATVQGDSVTLELNNQNDRLDPQQQRITQTQNTAARLTGRLNEWINVSGIGSEQVANDSDIGLRSKNYSTSNNTLRIKVQVID